ncbi:MAG: ATP-binding protein, partial [Acidimicrobiales bacterium]
MSGLVGRAGELAALVGALDDLGAQRASWAQVTGEPGIGKTRLLGELCRVAEARGALVLVGRGAEMERDIPFGIVIDALDDYLGALGEVRVAGLCGPQFGELCQVFPALAGPGRPGGARRLGDERYPTYRALRGLLERLAGAQPVVLVLDDLHWADVASSELVEFLLRRPPDAPVLTVLAWRPGQAPALASTVWSRARDVPGTALALGSLSEDEVGDLLGGSLDRPSLETLYRESGGNPFYAQALALNATRPTPPGGRGGKGQEPADGSVPGAVASAVRNEIGRLSPGARLLAQGGAVAGEPFEPELAARCAGLAPGDVVAGLDELVTAALVHAAESPRHFVFRHPIVRRAVYDSAGPGWRAAAHGRAAEALGRQGAAVTGRAHHVALCAAAGDSAAVELLLTAAVEVSARAPTSAAAWLDVAMGVVPNRPETLAVRVGIFAARARAACLLGDLEDARRCFVEALQLVAADDPERARLTTECARAEHGLGRFPEARSR